MGALVEGGQKQKQYKQLLLLHKQLAGRRLQARKKKKNGSPTGTRTRILRIRSPTPYPLGHGREFNYYSLNPTGAIIDMHGRPNRCAMRRMAKTHCAQ